MNADPFARSLDPRNIVGGHRNNAGEAGMHAVIIQADGVFRIRVQSLGQAGFAGFVQIGQVIGPDGAGLDDQRFAVAVKFLVGHVGAE